MAPGDVGAATQSNRFGPGVDHNLRDMHREKGQRTAKMIALQFLGQAQCGVRIMVRLAVAGCGARIRQWLIVTVHEERVQGALENCLLNVQPVMVMISSRSQCFELPDRRMGKPARIEPVHTSQGPCRTVGSFA